MALKAGDKAPEFELKDQDGFSTKLSDFKGKAVVLYFYPRDFTPACTSEACSFRDSHDRFKAKGVEILGVSDDPEESHKKFSDKHDLSFRLLADHGGKVSKAYGVWAKKNMYGKEFHGIKRTTFVISPEGSIRQVLERVDVKNHARDVLEAV